MREGRNVVGVCWGGVGFEFDRGVELAWERDGSISGIASEVEIGGT